MSLEFSIQPIDGTPTALLTNLVGTPLDLRSLEGLYAHRDFVPGMPWLVDNRGLARVPTVIDVDRIISALELRNTELGVAQIAVVASGPGVYGMGRFFAAASAYLPASVQAFTRMRAALKWLEAGAQTIPMPTLSTGVLDHVA